MKFKIKHLGIGLVLIGLLVACQTAPAEEAEIGEEPSYTIGVSAQLIAHDWSIRGAEGMREKAAELGVELIELSAGQDPEKQLADIESFIEQDVDGIIIMLAETGVLEQAVKKTNDAGIPVVFMNGGYEAPGVIQNISSDNYLIGEEAARFIGDQLGGEGKVVLQTYPPLEATNLRTIGAQDVWKAEYPGIEIIEDQPILGPEWTADAQAHAESMLAKYGDEVDAFGVCCDLLSVGAAPAIDAAGFGDSIIVTGTDGLEQAIEMIADPNSSYQLTFLQDSAEMGRIAVETVVTFLDEGGTVPVEAGKEIVEPVVFVPAIMITKENVKDYMP
jgi:ribose transport system substrate-binding protein